MIWLYRAPFSTNVERVALALAHKGLEVTSEVISGDDPTPMAGVTSEEMVPVLDDDGEVVPDSRRILRYLEERYPDPPLYPPDPTGRAEIEIFGGWFDGVWKNAPETIEWELETDEPDKAIIEAQAQAMQDSLGLFESLLAGREFLVGDSLSAADCIAFPFLKYAIHDPDPDDDELFHRILAAHQQPGSEHPRLLEWIARVDALPRV